MSAPTVAAAPRTRRRSFPLRLLAWIVSAALVVVAGVAVWLFWAIHSPLPQLDGNVKVAGLHQPVVVIRDRQGVPHVRAIDMHDLLFAQGYVTAQDRLWQMDLLRRFAAGEMAEVLGPEWIKHDRLQRILGLKQIAQRSGAALSPAERDAYQAYADGINEFLSEHSNRLPIEFRLLGYQPRPWSIEASFLIGANMVQTLSLDSFKHKIAHEKIIAKLGPQLASDLYPNVSWRDRPPVPDPQMPQPPAKAPNSPSEYVVQTSLETPRPLVGSRPGSNNWVVSGAHTLTGKPLLSNDMHLDLQIPDVWYEAHLELADGSFDVAGVTLPGLPYVIVGHNRWIAWGFTNLGPDVDDLYVENFNANGEYEAPQSWRKPEVRHEVIQVKAAPDVDLDVLVTRHGPIISDFVPGEPRKIALKWVLAETGLGNPFPLVNRAGDWQEFRAAFSKLTTPSQNVVYADVDGNIGYQATGYIPIRVSGDGALPVSGADNQHEWQGYIPFDQLPSNYNPASGILATANGRAAPLGYPHPVSSEWGAPYRVERIYQVLESAKKFAPADMLRLQTDVFSAYDKVCAEKLAQAVERTPSASPRARQAAALLRAWDGRMLKDSAAATIEILARSEFMNALLTAKLGSLAHDYDWYSSAVATENLITQQPIAWQPSNYKSYDELLTASIEKTVSSPAAAHELAKWRLGQQFPLVLEHPVLGRFPLLQRWAGPGVVSQDGSGETVKQVGAHGLGPSERFTANVADWDASTLNIVAGESGQIFSPYFMDQWKTWYGGTTFALPFSDEAIDRAAQHRLNLIPR